MRSTLSVYIWGYWRSSFLLSNLRLNANPFLLFLFLLDYIRDKYNFYSSIQDYSKSTKRLHLLIMRFFTTESCSLFRLFSVLFSCSLSLIKIFIIWWKAWFDALRKPSHHSSKYKYIISPWVINVKGKIFWVKSRNHQLKHCCRCCGCVGKYDLWVRITILKCICIANLPILKSQMLIFWIIHKNFVLEA